jgi:hypothetical protein
MMEDQYRAAALAAWWALDDSELATAMRNGNAEPDQDEVMSYADRGDPEAIGLVRRGYPRQQCAEFVWLKAGDLWRAAVERAEGGSRSDLLPPVTSRQAR